MTSRAFFGLLAFAVAGLDASAQAPAGTVLTIEMENVVQYQENYSNLTKNGTSASQEAPIPGPGTFSPGYFIADIVTINGRKSRGTTVARNTWFNLNTNPSGSQGIADINRFQAMDIVLEIQQGDGSSIGTLVLSGLSGGPAPLGAPKTAPTGNFAVVGGTGAFVGARGQAATIMNSHRATSTFENPINRRNFSAGLWKLAIQLIPLRTPEIFFFNGTPVIVHSSDWSLVTAAKPAHPGEILTLLASGIGPTRPGVDPGQVFTASPAQVASSPVEVLVNGAPGEVLYAGGYPNTVDVYQVNIRLPVDTAPGTAAIQLTAAWTSGSEVKFAVQ